MSTTGSTSSSITIVSCITLVTICCCVASFTNTFFKNCFDDNNSELAQMYCNIQVFPKVDHSANVARIVLVEYTIGSIVELNFC